MTILKALFFIIWLLASIWAGSTLGFFFADIFNEWRRKRHDAN